MPIDFNKFNFFYIFNQDHQNYQIIIHRKNGGKK